MNRTALFLAAQLLVMPPYGHAADLTVHVEGISKPEGHLLLAVANSAEAWDDKAPRTAARKLPATADAAEIVFADLAPGRYAVQVLHDANDNGRMDANLVGMPTEGYGFSNNPQLMRKARFDEAVIELAAEGSSITIRLN